MCIEGNNSQLTSFELIEEPAFSTTQAGFSAELAAGKPRRRGRSPRARRARRLLQATAADNSNQQTNNEGQNERYLVIPCKECPQHDANVQCFKRVRLPTEAWNRVRHLEPRPRTAEDRPTAVTTAVRRETEIRPPTGANVFAATYQTIRPMVAQQQPPPAIVNELPAAFGRGMGRGAMLLHLLNQQRAAHPGVTYPPPGSGSSTSYGRGYRLNAPLMVTPTMVPTTSAATATQALPPQESSEDEIWHDDEANDIIIL